jgi:hypothetical protein
MSIAKEEAHKLLERIPDDADWDDIIYQSYVRAKVEEALADTDEGATQEEMEQRYPLS